MAPGQEANIASSGRSIEFLYNYCMLNVLIRIEAILMSTHNIQFYDKIRKKSLNIYFLELLEELGRD